MKHASDTNGIAFTRDSCARTIGGLNWVQLALIVIDLQIDLENNTGIISMLATIICKVNESIICSWGRWPV